MKHFISCKDYDRKTLENIIHTGLAIKRKQMKPDFSGLALTLLFSNPSLRTRLSFSNGFQKYGGIVTCLDMEYLWAWEYKNGAVMNQDSQEHVKEAAHVISRYSDFIAIRNLALAYRSSTGAHPVSYAEIKKNDPVRMFSRYAQKPVINMESNLFHPCQAMADAMTIHEKLKKPFGDIRYTLTWAPHPRPLPLATPHSQLLLPSILGMQVTLACPEGFLLDDEIMETAKKHCRNFQVVHHQEDLKNRDVVVAKSWTGLKWFGRWEEEKKERQKHKNWMLTQEKMGEAMFMHCLPLRRNVVAEDRVVDGKNSCIIDEAENRMWVQLAILDYLHKENRTGG